MIEDKLLISIIVPVYNCEKYLRICLDSIVGQSYKNLQIILIDDGSTDSSGAICDEYAKVDNRIKVYHQKNAGVAMARNEGLKYIKGEYVCFVDGDDVVDMEYCKSMLNVALEYDLDIVLCNIVRFYDIFLFPAQKNILEYNIDFYDHHEAGIAFMKEKRFEGYVFNRFYKKEIVNECIFPAGIETKEDEFFNAQCMMKSNKIAYLNRDLYFYRQDNMGSITKQFTLKRMLDQYEMIRRKYELMKDEYPELRQWFITDMWKAAFICWKCVYVLGQEVDDRLKKSYNDVIKFLHEHKFEQLYLWRYRYRINSFKRIIILSIFIICPQFLIILLKQKRKFTEI